MAEISASQNAGGAYSITACSGAADCLRNATLVEPIMIASGMAHSVMTMTVW